MPFDDDVSLPFVPDEETPSSSETDAEAQADLPGMTRRGAERAAFPSWSGWVIGIVFGVLFGLWAFPPVRYTLGAQLQYALAEDNVPWMRALDTKRSVREIPRLDVAAASAPDDYLLQVGRATALADSGLRTPEPATPLFPGDDQDYSDRTLVRLGFVARDFPAAPGAYAHLARYMMLERVRLQRVELSPRREPASPPVGRSASSSLPPMPGSALTLSPTPPLSRSIPARRRDVRLMEWALRSGEANDSQNAFWPAMLATTYFASLRDAEGLRALARAARKSHWDAYIYEEVLGQWRLYSKAYGDNGASQKVGPLSLIAFPHLREVRRMAELARWHADRAAAAGHDTQAIHIRRNIAWLGLKMRDTSQWAYESLYGTDLLLIASMDSDRPTTQTAVRNMGQWEKEAAGYLGLLKRTRRGYDLAWLQREVAASFALRERLDLARYDASYPGIPPGIPLLPLFGYWMTGVCLLKQILTLSVAALLVVLWQRRRRRGPLLPRALRLPGTMLLAVLTGFSGTMLFSGVPSPRMAILFLLGITALALLGLERLHRPRFPHPERAEAAESLRGEQKVETRDEAAARWTWGTTLRLLTLLLIPGLGALYFLRTTLSELHPVAVLLTSLVGSGRTATAGDALEIAVLTCALPLAIVLTAGLWGVLRRVSPLAGAQLGLRRLAPLSLVCLTLAYLLVLNRTLSLDAAASRAINIAASNDLQWVLTHSSVTPED